MNVAVKKEYGLGSALIGGALVVLAVNITLAVLAVKTDVGYIEDKTWERGQEFQKIINSESSFRQEGWKGELLLSQAADNKTAITLHLSNQLGRPTGGFVVTLFAKRPDSTVADFQTELKEDSSGLYTAVSPSMKPGLWLFTTTLTRASESLQFSTQQLLP